MIEKLDWKKTGGLIPAIIQDHETLQVLMLGYMNEESLQRTLDIGQVVFFSRSRNRLWHKGEESGHFFEVNRIEMDCDADTLLISVRPNGPACHLQTPSCFGEKGAGGVGFLADLGRVIHARAHNNADGAAPSYTAKLLQAGLDRVAQKVGEEAVETVIAAKNEDPQRLVSEAADLIYHLLVLLEAKNLSLTDVTNELERRARR